MSYTGLAWALRKSTTRWTSSSERKAPWMRRSLVPRSENNMSPLPSRVSAPDWSRMVRESILEATCSATRLGKLALMRPVMTSTEGRWVARMRCSPAARAFCASRATEVSTSLGATIIRSANSSMTMTM